MIEVREQSKKCAIFIKSFIEDHLNKNNCNLQMIFDYANIDNKQTCVLEISGNEEYHYNLKVSSDYSWILYDEIFTSLAELIPSKEIIISKYITHPAYGKPDMKITKNNNEITIKIHRLTPEFYSVVQKFNSKYNDYNNDETKLR